MLTRRKPRLELKDNWSAVMFCRFLDRGAFMRTIQFKMNYRPTWRRK